MEVETTSGGVSGWIQAIAIGRRPKRTLVRLGLLIALGGIAALILNFVLLPVRITGPSMEPTYDNGQINFINRLAYLRHEPQRGDVVGIRLSGDRTMYVKRIVGMPGETIHFSHG
jgi:signal peptidase I